MRNLPNNHAKLQTIVNFEMPKQTNNQSNNTVTALNLYLFCKKKHFSKKSCKYTVIAPSCKITVTTLYVLKRNEKKVTIFCAINIQKQCNCTVSATVTALNLCLFCKKSAFLKSCKYTVTTVK